MSDNQEATITNYEDDGWPIEEYRTLRAEIIKRLELRTLMISITIVAFGTLMGIGVQSHSADIILVYSPLAALLTGIWVAEDRAIRTLGAYIRVNIEPHLGMYGRGWEHFAQRHRKRGRGLHYRAVGGIFFGSQALALVIAAILNKPERVLGRIVATGSWGALLTSENVLFTVWVGSFIVTILELSRRQATVPTDDDLRLARVGK